jgi:hypothetical protein
MKTWPVQDAKVTLKELLLSDIGRAELEVSPRRDRRRRKPKRVS